ncbi:MAG: hypothetical protein IT419_02405, partial [Planctomycetes bacterium]|nr:hypothetical protein [Planctomycetota bacterium]
LGDLVPTYIAEVPMDAYSGSELRYDSAAPYGPRLYSVGRNMKDDNGVSKTPLGQSDADRTTLDLVFWPEDHLK